MTFQTSSDGQAIVDFSNIVYENLPGQGNALQATIVKANSPCIGTSYEIVASCVDNGINNFSLNATNLEVATTYYIIVNGAMGDESNAEATFDVEIHGEAVDRNADIGIWTEETKVCKGNSTKVFVATEGCENQSVFTWYINGIEVANSVEPVFVVEELVDGDEVHASVTCFEDCPDTLESYPITFEVVDFEVDAGEDVVINKGENVQLHGTTTESNVTWKPPYNISDTTTTNPIVYPEETTTYFFVVDNGECSITDEVTVFVESNLVIPNTFTPNGDNINDRWEILGIEEFPDCQIEVFDRWGQLVFQTTGYSANKRWDGTSLNGKRLTAGAYYYVINLRDENYEEPLKGTVRIIR